MELGSGSAKAEAPSGASGLPAHQRRNKASVLATAGAAAVANNPGGGAAHWSSAVRQPSPRMEPPPEVVLVSSRSAKSHVAQQSGPRDPPGTYISAGIHMMFPSSSSAADLPSKISPQTSPRAEASHAVPRPMAKADSTASLQSRASTLAEPQVQPPPATALKPARSSYAGGTARLSSPRNDGGSGPGSRHGSAKSPRAHYQAEDEDGATPTGSAVGRLRGSAMTDSRRSPMSSPRAMQLVGKADSAQSMLAEPIMLPLPATVLQPELNAHGASMFAISEGSSLSRLSHSGPDSVKSSTRKSLRIDGAGPAHAASTQVSKIELSFGGSARSGKDRSLEKQVI
jgi:hypothetical protein